MSQMSTESVASESCPIVSSTIRQQSPSSPVDDNDPLKFGRKREREVSAEPSSLEHSSQHPEVPTNEPHPRTSDLAVPAKKNKLEPASPTDSDASGPTTPPRRSPKPIIMTPQHESKVKQIRKRVEDMSWQDAQGKAKALPEDVPTSQDDEQKSEVKDDTESERSDKLESIELSSSVDDKPEEEPSKTISIANKNNIPNGESVKRPRDDADVDANPRETKRPSPPPPKDIPAESSGNTDTVTASASGPIGGFLSFASAISPFGQAKAGPSAWSTGSSSSNALSPKPPSPPDSKEEEKDTGRKPLASPFTLTIPPPKSRESPGPSDKPKPLFGVTTAPGVGFTGFGNLKPTFGTTSMASMKATGSASTTSGPKRSKSPTHGNAFTPYNTSMRGFGVTPKPTTRRKRSTSPGGRSAGSPERSGPSSWSDNENAESALSFADRLKKEDKSESQSEEPVKGVLQEQELVTGEEGDETVFSIRAKLYILSDQKQWKERGTGPLKVNVRKDTSNARLVMRKEGVHSLILNVSLFREMKLEVAQDPRYVRFAIPSATCIDHYTLRLSSAKGVEDLVEAVQARLPQ